ncbi:MAG TPA: hypothetical protein VFN78_03150 [Ktedonobacterales bacterium]|nr:hypothetical protein [Ktedonobacterales bacterium]
MGITAMRTIFPTRGISVFITPVARPRPAFGVAWDGVPGLPAPIRWRETHTLRGFHDY